MAVLEIQRLVTDAIPMTEILIGEHLDQPHGRVRAAKVARFRNDPIKIHLPSGSSPMTLENLREYAVLVQQVLTTAEQFAAEIADEPDERKAA